MSALAHPEWLAAVVAALSASGLAVLLSRWWARRRLRALLGALAPRSATAPAADLALVAAAACIGLALLGPRIGERVVRVPSTGIDLVLLFDVSRSMDARDVAPSRIDRARRTASQVLERLAPGDRAALAAFADRGVLLTPLTPDTAALGEMLPALDSELMQPGGSNVAAGVEAAVAAFEVDSARPRVLLVLSDGEDPEVRRDVGASRAARAGARTIAVAFGGDRGTIIPDHGVPLRDAAGAVIYTRRNPERLAPLAAATGGELVLADAAGRVDPARLVAEIRRDAGTAPGEMIERRVAAARVWPCAALAYALLALEAIPAARRRRSNVARRGSLRVAATGLLLPVLVQPGADVASAGERGSLARLEARVRERPGDARDLIALGLERMERGEREAAARAFLAAAVYARDSETAALAHYDLGVAALGSGDLPGARDAFFDALALAPADRRARFNLEWTLRALARAPERAQPRPEASPPRPEPQPARPDDEESGRERAERLREPEAAARAQPQARELGEAERRRLLALVEDDPRRAFRDAALRAAGGERGRPRRTGPQW